MISFIAIASVVIIGILLIPVLYQKMPKKEAPKPKNQFIVDRENLTCTCQEWQTQRANFKLHDPRRLCVHCCEFLRRDIMHVPEKLFPFLHLIEHFHSQGKGIPLTQPSFAFVLGEYGYLVSLPTGGNVWATIYYADQEFMLNVVSGEWGPAKPPFAGETAKLVRAQYLKRKKRNTSQTPPEKKEENADKIIDA